MSGGSTLPRRALGRRLRDLRLKAGKSLLAAAVQIDVSKQTIGRMEEGQYVRISSAQYQYLLDLYEANQAARDDVVGLIGEAKAAKGDSAKGWWRAYDDVVNRHFDHFMSLEQACNKMTTFQLTLLPGLLQTPAYRRWIVEVTDPAMSPVDVERRLELIARRQQRVSRDPGFSLEAILSESSLRYQVGGSQTMSEQARYLMEIGNMPNVSIRVIPFGARAHPGLVVQSFTLFDFPSLSTSRLPEPSVAFVEGFTGALFLEDGGVIERYRSTVAALRQVALSEDDTRRLVQEIAEEYGS